MWIFTRFGFEMGNVACGNLSSVANIINGKQPMNQGLWDRME
jgi:hypothetical protein